MTSLIRPRQKPTLSAYQKRSGWRAFGGYLSQNWLLFVLGAPAILLIFAFSYIPMFGTVIAFEDFSPRSGFLSTWVGLKNFTLLWNSPVLWRLLRNTVTLNMMFIAAETVTGVVLALLLNEVRSTVFKRVSQSVMFLPYFMGWTIVAMVLFGLIDYEVGTINVLLQKVGLEKVLITNNADLWPAILTFIRVWKYAGSGCIIYLAVLVGIDPQLHEAAAIDGADRWQRMRYISLPALLPVVILLTLLAIGRIFYGDLGMIYAVIGNKATLFPTTDVIDTWILRALATNANYGLSAAVGLSQAVLGFIFVFGSNWLVKKYSKARGEDYTLF
jgi:putative aldouronate transport system permease protein